jgi:hypothetical protein
MAIVILKRITRELNRNTAAAKSRGVRADKLSTK